MTPGAWHRSQEGFYQVEVAAVPRFWGARKRTGPEGHFDGGCIQGPAPSGRFISRGQLGWRETGNECAFRPDPQERGIAGTLGGLRSATGIGATRPASLHTEVAPFQDSTLTAGYYVIARGFTPMAVVGTMVPLPV